MAAAIEDGLPEVHFNGIQPCASMKDFETLYFCNMNCGNPVLTNAWDLFRTCEKEEKLREWVQKNRPYPSENLELIRIRSETDIWNFARKAMSNYARNLSEKRLSFDLDSEIRKLKKRQARQKVIVYTRPLYDFATWYTYDWSKEAVDHSVQMGLAVVDLSVELATRKNIETVLTELDPIFYSHSGHGNEVTIFGNHNEPMIDKQNCHILKDCSASILACKTASQLGPAAIEAGCRSYMGYNDNFYKRGEMKL